MAFTPRSDDLLLVVDLQYDFLPGGSLAVAGGDEIIILINRLGRQFNGGVEVHRHNFFRFTRRSAPGCAAPPVAC